jgi:GT2 family glycosyltransferase/tetratricopeptide (TPR) repeat protein
LGTICELSEKLQLTSIIVLTLNQLEYTQLCIQSLFKHTRSPFELIIIDNGSKDNTIDYISSLKRSGTACIRIKLIANPKNVGFAAGCNQGMREARGEHVLLLNNDVVVTPGWLARMTNVMTTRPNVGLVGPMSNCVSGPQLVRNPQYDSQTLKGLVQFSQCHAEKYSNQIIHRTRVVGFCILIRHSVIAKIGGLDHRYGLGNFEDDDFCLRAHLAGFQSVIAKECFVHHFGGRTFLGNKISYEQKMRENWKLFKQKWNIPFDTPLSSGYTVSLSPSAFDPAVHFVPLHFSEEEIGSVNTTTKQTALTTVEDFKHSNTHSLSLEMSGEQDGNEKLSGGTFMSIVDQIVEAVKNLISPKEKNVAIWILERLIAEVPEHADAHHELGLLFYENSRLEDAHTHLQKAVKLEPANFVFGKDFADFLHVAEHDYEKAIDIYSNIINLQQDNLDILMTLGHLNLSQHKLEQARYFYRRVLDIDPENMEVRDYLDRLNESIEGRKISLSAAELPSQTIKQSKAVDTIEADCDLSAMDQQLALYHNDQGVMAFQQGNKESSLNHYIKAVTLEPNNSVYLKNLGDYYWIELNDARSALERYVQVLTHDPLDVEALLACGHICMALDKQCDAREFFDNVLAIEPWNDIALKLRESLDAIETDDNHSSNRDNLYQLAKEKAKQKDFKGAIADLTHLLSEFPNDAEIYNDLGVINFQIGHKEKALDCYEKAVRRAPDQSTFQKNLADFYFLEQGRAQEAMKLYVSVLEKNPQDVECLMAIGFVCNSLNKQDDAQSFFQQVLEIEPWNASALNALEQLNNYKEESKQGALDDNGSIPRKAVAI